MIETPEDFHLFETGHYELYRRISITADAHPNVMSTVEQFADKKIHSMIKFTDANGNTMELDPMMRHAIAHCERGQSLFNYLPSSYKSYTIFVGTDVVATKEDVMALEDLMYAEHILVALSKGGQHEDFVDQFTVRQKMNKLSNVHLSYV